MEYQQLKKFMETYKEEMTPTERLREYKLGKEVDHIPYTLLGADPAIAEILGYTTSQVGGNFEILTDVIEKKEREFGLTGLNVGLGLRTLGEALGSELYIPKHGIDYVKRYILEDYKDLSRLENKNPRKNSMFLDMLEFAKKLKDRFPNQEIETGVSGPISTASAIRPIELILRDTRKNPEHLKRLLQLSVDQSLVWIEMFCEEFGKTPVGFSDPVTCMNVLSKKQYDEFSRPYIEQLVNGIHKITGYDPDIHICGKTKPIWSSLKDMSISIFSIDNCEDLKEAKDILGKNMGISGNVPPVEIMKQGTIDEVIDSCVSCIKKAGDSPRGFQLNTGCQVPLGTPRENMEALIFAARVYGEDAKMGEMPKGMSKICEEHCKMID